MILAFFLVEINAFAFRLKPTLTQLQLKASMSDTHTELVAAVSDGLKLQATDYTLSLAMDSWAEGGWKGAVQWLTETSPNFLTGVGVASTTSPEVPHDIAKF